jgi:protein-S-isoprenylcysteine O-methyltransferase Ste14
MDVVDEKRVSLKFLARGVMGVALIGILLFLPARRVRWKAGWAHLGVRLLAHVATTFLVAPDLLVERSEKQHANQKGWDPLFFFLYGLINARVVPVLAGLSFRFGWRPQVGSTLRTLAAVLYLLGNVICIWAMRANRFFSSVVRIQEDRGQVVVSEGPYRWMRHPGYVGFIVQSIAAPLMLGSFWATLAGATGALLVVVRTVLEDRTLAQELPGYAEYAEEVPWRLIPGVW